MTAALELATLVTRVARAAGVPAEHDEVLRCVDELGAFDDPRARLDAAAAVAGLRSSRFQASVLGLPDKHRALPATAPATHGGAHGYVTVLAPRRRRFARHFDVVDVDGEVLTLSPAELAQRVGVPVDEAVEWSALEPALPMAAVARGPADHGSADASAQAWGLSHASTHGPTHATTHGAPHGGAGGAGHGDHHPTPWQRLQALVRLERHDLFVIAAYGIVTSLVALATPLAVQALVGTIAFGNLLQPLVVLSGVLVLALLVAGALRTLQLVVVEVLLKRLFVRLVADLGWRLPRVAMAVRDEVDGSKLVNRFFDVLTVQKATSTLLLDGFSLVLELCVALALLGFYSNSLLAFSLLLFVAVVFVVFVLGRNGVATSVAESVAKHDVAGWLEDLVRHPMAFRTATSRAFGLSRIEAFTREYLAARGHHFTVLLRQSVAGFALQAVAASALLGVGGALVLAGQLTLGQLVAAELIVGSVVAALAKLGKQLESAYDLLAAVDKIGHLVDLPVERDDGAALRPHGPLGFAAVDLAVDVGGAHPRTLSFGSFSVEQGSAVAVIGDSGAGKSTLTGALVGLRAPSHGRVSVDGDDIRTLSLQDLRARVAVVRDDETFEGTIAENLRVGRTGIATRALVEALRIVELDDVVLDHAEGLGRLLVPGSGALSSGQARRLMLARALVGMPGLLIVDGTLDGLAHEQAARIVRRLQKSGATVLVMTSRSDIGGLLPRRLRLADDGVVDDGRDDRKNDDNRSDEKRGGDKKTEGRR
jgi:ABC-type bacteriocin/lantibiotic exporter with double-glycine peptidase domain